MLAIIPLFFMSLLGLKCSCLIPTGPCADKVFREAQTCTLSWEHDPTNRWNNFSVDLMSGSGYNMNVVTNVFRGMDGTRGRTSYSWKCPRVRPHSHIYFYRFSQAGQPSQFTAWFTIASKSGKIKPPAFSVQPDGRPIPWGYVRIKIGDSKKPKGPK